MRFDIEFRVVADPAEGPERRGQVGQVRGQDEWCVVMGRGSRPGRGRHARAFVGSARQPRPLLIVPLDPSSPRVIVAGVVVGAAVHHAHHGQAPSA
jgi:hypothetical protein